MKLNNEQRAAVAAEENICLRACPGSGKTRTIIAKLLKCIDEVRNTPRRIACITYTHAAVDEILLRLREYGATGDDDYYEVGTIHSFCLSNILQPFYFVIPQLQSGFDIIAPDSERWQEIVLSISQKYAMDSRNLGGFANVHRMPNHSIFVPSDVVDEAAKELVAYLDEHGLVSFSDIVYHSCTIINTAPFVARGLASRFAWMLIDEFQDTSTGQVMILNAIAKYYRTKFFIVGDLNQSIMAFAGAHPDLMHSFSKNIKAREDISLMGNYRCSQKIVQHAESLISSEPRMQAVGAWKDYVIDPEYVHVADRTSGIFDHYLPVVDQLSIPLGEAAVLAPWWVPLYHLGRELRERGVPVIGPGARPYRGNRLFGHLAEHLCACTEDSNPEYYRATQRALFVMLLNITGTPDWRVYSYDGRKCLCRLLALAREIRDEYHDEAVSWLRTMGNEVSNYLLSEDFLDKRYSTVLEESVRDMIQDMERNQVDIANLSVSDLGLYAKPRDCLQLITMHSSKGREFDAVGIIDLHDGRIPHFKWETQAQYDEARRQLYVAITRARKLLMYFTDSSNYRNKPSPFLSEMGLNSKALSISKVL